MYVLASLFEVLAKMHEPMLTAHEIMETLRGMFKQPSVQLKHDTLKFIFNARMEEEASVREQKLNIMVYFNMPEMNESVIDEASQGDPYLIEKFHQVETGQNSELQLTFKQKISDAQRSDFYLVEKLHQEETEQDSEYSLSPNNGLYYHGRLCIFADSDLKNELLA
ncbi:uncharacterized protein LOC120076290 [Benincasa hispida]|uniref:uncharacterized protein LOC120076290 n=1 Tax=Benincasa hispida TaxID=102211 RepID=UPI0018FF5537|nr:uncharacterized protein LOC120076290 [Benincasa hispida]